MSKVSIDRGGRVNTKAGAIRGSLDYAGDYFGWTQKELLPHMAAAGVKEGPARDALMAKIGRNRNTTRMLTMFSDPEFVAQITKDIGIFRKSMGLDKAYDDFTKNDPKGVRSAFDKQYDSMMGAIGAPMMQAALPVMRGITSLFTDIGAFANAHPQAIQTIAVGIAGLGAAFIGAGAAALVAAIGTGGWLAAGIVGLSAALVAVSAKGVMKDFAALDTAIDGFFRAFKGGVAADIAAVASAVETLFASIKGFFGKSSEGPGGRFGVSPGAGGGRYHPSLYEGGAKLERLSYGTPVTSTGSGLYDAIMSAEGTKRAGYDTVLGNGAYGLPDRPVSTMTLAQAYDYGRTLRHRNPFNSSAIGAFQITGTTMRDAARALGYDWSHDKFDAAHQKAMASWIAAHQGLGAWEGFKSHPDELARARRFSGPPPHRERETVIKVPVHLDGKVIASVVTKHQAKACTFPDGIHSGPDDRGFFIGPGSTFQPA